MSARYAPAESVPNARPGTRAGLMWRLALMMLVPWFGGACTTGGQTFPVPSQIVVSVAPYESVEAALADLEKVDWDRDPTRARAVTSAYAAQEIQRHLSRAGFAASVVSAVEPQRREPITLALQSPSSGPSSPPREVPAVDYASLGEQGYAIVPDRGRLLVTARTRIGLLYGTYALLEELGFAWDDPYDARVPHAAALSAPRTWRRIQETPRVALRGFWIYGGQRTPDEFAVWMARNRFNVGGTPRPALRRLLGIKGWGGGHDLLQEEFSRPGLFEKHPGWFAETGGVRRPVAATGVYFNPSFASEEAAVYFTDRLVARLEAGDLVDDDVLNIWPTDSRFNLFDQSAAALALGNETDNLLNFYANVCEGLRRARAEGRLSRPVTVAGISYFLTMTPPTNPLVIAKLRGEDYLHLFYPIDRDWSGPLDEGLGDRDANRAILGNMNGWGSVADLDFGVVEYHNLSSYGAVSLTDHLSLALNYSVIGRGRNALYAYTHPLLRNPGPRRLTNLLQAKLAWCDATEPRCEATLPQRAEAVTQDYFLRRFGEHASAWRTVYGLMAKSVENSKEMFFSNSLHWVLFQKYIWASPPYTTEEAVGFVGKYRVGGVQDLPAAFSGRVSERATFRGLDDSIALQREASRRWAAAMSSPTVDDATRSRMESDVAWFEATASRYRLMAASADLAVSRQLGLDESAALERISAEVSFLDASPVIRDTISPVDQSAFLAMHRQLANLP